MKADVGRLRWLLDRLERHMAQQDRGSLADRLLPGASEQYIDKVTASLGLRLPIEARTWWNWHDGYVPHDLPRNPSPDYLAGTAFLLMPLAEAADEYRRWRRLAAEPRTWPKNNPDDMFSPQWFPILRAAGTVVVDCSVRQGSTTPLRLINWEDVTFDDVRSPSLTAVVQRWVDLLDDRTWTWAGDRWISKLPGTHPTSRRAALNLS